MKVINPVQTKDKMKPVKIKSFSEYARFISEKCDEDDLLFRGQPIDRTLLPKIARVKIDNSKRLLAVEKEMLQEFKRQSIPFLELYPETNWDWLALAQHHGIATRLLDWTTNPFAALWFAVEKPYNFRKQLKTQKSDYGVVWIFYTSKRDFVSDPYKHNPFQVDRTRIFRPRHITRRIVSQFGWFTIHKYISSKGKFLPLEHNKRYSKNILKIKIPPSEFAQIRRELDRCGFNAFSLFPGLDGLCRHIQWQHTLLKDEFNP